MVKKSLTFNLIYSRCCYSMLSVYVGLGFLKILKQFIAYVLQGLNEIFVSELTFPQNSWLSIFFS